VSERDPETEPKPYSRVLVLIIAALLGVLLAQLAQRFG
jgi:hypothetical protein